MLPNPQAEPKSDEALIAEYQRDPAGGTGQAAADELLDRWSERVYLWARRSLRDHDRALDLAQDCLLQAYRALDRYEARGRFAAWLFTIVHNRCASVARRRSLNIDPEVDPDALIGSGSGPEAEIESDETRRELLATMETILEPHERAALWLRVEEGVSVDEITRLLRLDGASGARGVLQTARRKLRAALERSGERGAHE